MKLRNKNFPKPFHFIQCTNNRIELLCADLQRSVMKYRNISKYLQKTLADLHSPSTQAILRHHYSLHQYTARHASKHASSCEADYLYLPEPYPLPPIRTFIPFRGIPDWTTHRSSLPISASRAALGPGAMRRRTRDRPAMRRQHCMKAIVKAPLRHDGVELICTRMKGQLPCTSAPRWAALAVRPASLLARWLADSRPNDARMYSTRAFVGALRRSVAVSDGG